MLSENRADVNKIELSRESSGSGSGLSPYILAEQIPSDLQGFVVALSVILLRARHDSLAFKQSFERPDTFFWVFWHPDFLDFLVEQFEHIGKSAIPAFNPMVGNSMPFPLPVSQPAPSVNDFLFIFHIFSCPRDCIFRMNWPFFPPICM
jgi:hypothetical protein